MKKLRTSLNLLAAAAMAALAGFTSNAHAAQMVNFTPKNYTVTVIRNPFGTVNNPFFPPSGPATGFSIGPHLKSKFLAVGRRQRRHLPGRKEGQ